MNIQITIQDVTPLLMNRFTDASADEATKGTRLSVKAESETPREQSEPKVYRDKDGKIVVPGANLFRCLIDAGKYHKVGKSKVTTLKSSLVPAAISLLEIECPVRNRVDSEHNAEPAWEVDSRPIVNPSTGGRRMCHRPRFDQWTVSFTLAVDTKMFSAKTVRLLVDDAGSKIGLGDFRPDRKGSFGKFTVVDWKELS